MDSKDVARIRRVVWRHYKAHGRHDLPWRMTLDPYCILVSEVMLQQTPVLRVLPKYHEFLIRFPTVQALAQASLRDVLVIWQGLGYNRRAKMLHEAARQVVSVHAGVFPQTYEALVQLPGVGPYTAQAVCVFAYNIPGAMVETNIRTVLFHHLDHMRAGVRDAELYGLIDTLCPRGRAREWYWALMGYGAHLKRNGVRLNHRSKHYAKQSKFEGSDRQVRGAILRALATTGVASKMSLVKKTHSSVTHVSAQLARLVGDGLVERCSRGYTLPGTRSY